MSENIVFQKGTPKLKKKLKGSVFSLLTGGGGNENYWHWLFDVLPRFKILENQYNYGGNLSPAFAPKNPGGINGGKHDLNGGLPNTGKYEDNGPSDGFY